MELNVPAYFLDDALIGRQQRVVRRWLPATVNPTPLLGPDRPWEGRSVCNHGGVVHCPDGTYRLYYTQAAPPRTTSRIMLATSDDGFGWTKPELGIIDWGGARENNLVLTEDQILTSPSVILDVDDGDAPYKMIAFGANAEDAADARARGEWQESWGLYVYTSPDGLRWSGKGKRLAAGDRTNLLDTVEDGRFVAYTRHPEPVGLTGGRAIFRIESDDFLHWSPPELVLAPDLTDEADVEFYGMAVFKRHGWYFGLVEYWFRDLDVLEVHLAFSADGRTWSRPEVRAPFIAGGTEWNRKWTSCAPPGAVDIGGQHIFYIGGNNFAHNFDSAQQHGVIGFASLPLDRFAAIEGKNGGLLETVPLRWPGGNLVVNADTRESFQSHPRGNSMNGEITVEILDSEGRPVSGLSGSDRAIFRGNTHARFEIEPGIVRWGDGASLDRMRGNEIRFRFGLEHARLFTIEARPD
jgi:hypothetical protein